MVDEYLAEDAASKAAFLNRIVGSAATAVYLGATIASYSGLPVASIIGDVVLSTMDTPEGLLSSEWWGALNSAVSTLEGIGSPMVLQDLLGNMELSYNENSVHYAGYGGAAFLGGSVIGAPALFEQLLNSGPRNNVVYRGLDRAGNTVYYGITDNLSRRTVDHGARFARVEPVRTGLTRMQARG